MEGDELVTMLGITFGQLLQLDADRARSWLETTFEQLAGKEYKERIARLEKQIIEKEKECVRLKRGILIVGPEEYHQIRAEQRTKLP